jgi:hypothetical protein
MGIILFARPDQQHAVAELSEQELELRLHELESTDGPTGGLIAGLREAERALADADADAVLVAGADDAALAAALTAVKLQIPTAWLAGEGDDAGVLIGRVADEVIDASGPAEEVAARVAALARP